MMGDDRDERRHRFGDGLVEAARIARTVPLLGHDHETTDGGDPLDRGWFSGPLECARLQATLTGGKERTGWAFGVAWPWVEVGGVALAPALPVAATTTEQEGPDGAYRQVGDRVLREAGGREKPLLTKQGQGAANGAVIDALWFSDTARFVLHHGLLEVEDLFSRLVAPARQSTIERLLVRCCGHAPAILEHLPEVDVCQAGPTLAVARAEAVMAPNWIDPEAFFKKGIGFESAVVSEDRLVARGGDRQPVELALTLSGDGWRAVVTSGNFPFESLAIERDDRDIVLTATVIPAIDPLAQGMRERLAFDLRSFLISLAG
jgi:hypothetical protein